MSKSRTKKTLWVKLIQNRVETGEPYIMFQKCIPMSHPEIEEYLDMRKPMSTNLHHGVIIPELQWR